MQHLRRMATLSRSWRLLRSFRHEQPRPYLFYSGLAKDTSMLIDALWRDTARHNGDRRESGGLAGKSVLDVGGGPGYYAQEFERLGAWYVGVEPSISEMAAAGLSGYGALRGEGEALPIRSESFDVVFSSNVAEHVPNWRAMGEEMLRVVKPGGLVVVSYTVWLGPFGGHETGLWQHYVGGEFARRRYEKRHGHPPKNVWGTSLFAVSASEGLEWAGDMVTRREAEEFWAFPRYHPWWASWVARVPGLRELATSNLVVALRR